MRRAWVAEHREKGLAPLECIPPEFRTVGEGGTRTERSTPWLTEPVLFPIIERNSRRELGFCNATENTLRLWAWEQTGHLYGSGSFGRRLRAEHARGKLERRRVPPGGRFKNGQLTRSGTTTNRFPSEKERRQRLWREKQEKRRQRREANGHQRAERNAARRSSEPTRVVPRPIERERAEQITRRSADPVRVAPPMPRSGEPRTAIADVTREPTFAALPLLGSEPTTESLSAEAQMAKHQAEVDRQVAAAKLWAAQNGVPFVVSPLRRGRREPPD